LSLCPNSPYESGRVQNDGQHVGCGKEGNVTIKILIENRRGNPSGIIDEINANLIDEKINQHDESQCKDDSSAISTILIV